jgi:hypothetical protein
VLEKTQHATGGGNLRKKPKVNDPRQLIRKLVGITKALQCKLPDSERIYLIHKSPTQLMGDYLIFISINPDNIKGNGNKRQI